MKAPMMLRMLCVRTALASNRCCAVVLEGTAPGRVLSHDYDYGCEIDRVREEVLSMSGHASCRSSFLVSATSACSQNTAVGDSASANVNECGHDGCGSWLKLVKHRMQPYSDPLWPYSIER